MFFHVPEALWFFFTIFTLQERQHNQVKLKHLGLISSQADDAFANF